MGIFITVLVGSFRVLSTRINEGDAVLHARVNKVKEEYVRRDDFEKAMSHTQDLLDAKLSTIQSEVAGLRRDLGDHNARVLAILEKGQHNS